MCWTAWGRRALTCAIAGGAVLAAAAGAAVKKAPLHWSAPVHVGHNGLSGLSCPSSSLCIAGSGDGLLVSTNPSGGPGNWKLVFVPPTKGSEAPQVVSVSCASARLCLATTLRGDVLISANPAGGTSAWSVTGVHLPVGQLPNYHSPVVSCASKSLCVAAAEGGRAVFSTSNPAGGPRAWKSVQLRRPIETITCAAPHLCIAGDDRGDVVSSAHPTGRASAWHSVHVFGRPGGVEELGAAACASTRWCMIAAIDFDTGVMLFASNPTGNIQTSPGAWRQQVAAAPHQLFVSGSCSADRLCAFLDTTGTVYFPTSSFRGLTKTRVDHPSSAADRGGSLACVSRHWCALAAADGNFYIGTG